ncbi:hypothetical protein, partial [Mesotoga sp. B105.6.4]|uniref:hypothetical protein n=1 Tax=Mesotoga sp. B105.6.4 TaxID=1582224 RepID=UPI000CCF04C8
MDRRTEISRSFFDYLNKKAFPYVVLRNADQITTHLGHDIDMCIDKKRVGFFEEVLREFCLLMKLDAYSTQQISYFNVYVIYDKENQFFIRIDTFTAFDYRGVPILD